MALMHMGVCLCIKIRRILSSCSFLLVIFFFCFVYLFHSLILALYSLLVSAGRIWILGCIQWVHRESFYAIRLHILYDYSWHIFVITLENPGQNNNAHAYKSHLIVVSVAMEFARIVFVCSVCSAAYHFLSLQILRVFTVYCVLI